MLAIDGRKEDYVVLRNGARVGRMDHIFKDMVAVREAQIVQNEPGALIVRLVRAPQYTAADEARLRSEFASRLGQDARVEFRVRRIDSENGLGKSAVCSVDAEGRAAGGDRRVTAVTLYVALVFRSGGEPGEWFDKGGNKITLKVWVCRDGSVAPVVRPGASADLPPGFATASC